eukprot:242408-Hanusia_phi.AAC.1
MTRSPSLPLLPTKLSYNQTPAYRPDSSPGVKNLGTHASTTNKQSCAAAHAQARSDIPKKNNLDTVSQC